jgi:hypothetical protein
MNCAWRAKKLATVLKDSLNSQNKSASRHSGPLKVAAAPTFHWKLKRRINKNIQRWTKSVRRQKKSQADDEELTPAAGIGGTRSIEHRPLEFIDENGGGPGVRLRERHQKKR